MATETENPAAVQNAAMPRRIHIVVDGIVYGFQRYGGINTYFNEILPRIALRHSARVDVLLPAIRIGRPPKGPVRIGLRNVVPGRTGISSAVDRMASPVLDRINSVALQLRLRSKRNCVFHSTYFTWIEGPIPQVASVYDMNHELLPKEYDNPWGRWLRRQYYEYLKRATRIIAVSHNTRDDVIRYYGIRPDVIDVVHLAVDRSTFWPERGNAQLTSLQALTGISQPYLLYVGLRQAYKNFRRLLVAFAQSSLRRHAYLVVAGGAWKRSELELIGELNLATRVRLVRDPSDSVLRRLYSCASAFVYPSCHEGFGIPLLEAMACETLVLASDIAVFREVAGEAAIYFDPSDTQDMSAVLESALDSPTRDVIISRGCARIARFGWDACADQTYAVYGKALAGKRIG